MKYVLTLVAALVVGLVAACGDDAPPRQAIASTQLSVAVSSGAATRQATLTCGTTAAGTGHLASPEAAKAACDLVEGSASSLVRDGVDRSAICTQQYGGPQLATITGSLEGQSVNTTIGRANGCGISAWEKLEPLLGPVQ